MRARDFITQIRDDDIVGGIRAAEQRTSGQIRVFISRKMVDDPVTAAHAAFHRLGMEKTRHRNGVLIYVAPRSRKFAVIGDAGIHKKCGDAFWQELAKAMTEFFRRSEFTQGIMHGIAKAGELFAEHFPRQPDDSNEVPNRVAHD